jgi:hypothetical protein
MKTNINRVIEEWIGVDKDTEMDAKHYDHNSSMEAIGYNQALADLRSRIPELEEKILKEIKCSNTCGYEDPYGFVPEEGCEIHDN